MTSFIDDLREDGLAVDDLNVKTNSVTPKAARPTFPCESCAGTGKYRGVRVHQTEEKCFACKGKGYFFTSYKDRQAKRVQSRVSKATKLASAKAEFEALNGALLAKVRADLLPWNGFAASLIEHYDAKGSLSDRQIESLQAQCDKNDARQAERNAAKAAETKKLAETVVDTSPIRDLFATAKGNGLKKPGLWFGDLKISEAPDHGRNAGALYVKRGGEYAGKIIGATFHPAWGVKPTEILPTLLEIAGNPAEVLRVKGKETGKCCCCGRELTDPASIAAGIGPICATNWGL